MDRSNHGQTTEMPLLLKYSTLSKVANSLRVSGEKLTGQAEILLVQTQVKQRKEELKLWRNELSIAVKSYEDIQTQLKGLYARKTQVYQHHTKELSLLQAINNEEETLLFEEQKIGSHVEGCKRKERECFESLSDAIQDSHEKERAQSERMQYLARIGSLMGAVLGFLGSNFFFKREIRQYIVQQSDRLKNIEVLLARMQLSSGKFLQSEEVAADDTVEKYIKNQMVSTSDDIKSISEVQKIDNHLEGITSHKQLKPLYASQDTISNTELGLKTQTVHRFKSSEGSVLLSLVSYSVFLAVLAVL